MGANDHEYALNWNNYSSHLKKAFDSLLTANEFIDVTLSCEGKKISAHKMLLSACSTYFHDLFRDNPCQHPIVIFRDVKFQDLEYLLTFMYSGEVSVPTENLDSFLRTAELLHISGLNGEQNRTIDGESEHCKPCDETELFQQTRPLLKRHTDTAQEMAETSADGVNDNANTSEENINKKLKLEEMDFDSITEIKQEKVEIINIEPEEFSFDDPLSLDNVDLLQPSGSQRLEEVQDLLNAEAAAETTLESLPAKSKERYEKEFRAFVDWRNGKNVRGVNEEIVLEYFRNLEKSFKPSTLCTKYSMLRATLNESEHVDISSFRLLLKYLKEKGKNFKAKISKSLERGNIERFLLEAPDEQYLLLKIVLIFGVAGRCGRTELYKLKLQDIEDKGSYLSVTLPDAETNKARKFVVINEAFGLNVLDIYKKYRSLRPKNVSHDRFLLTYKNSKCTVQTVGMNAISQVPKLIATYLNLPNPEKYTGHCLRRSSATLYSFHDAFKEMQTF